MSLWVSTPIHSKLFGWLIYRMWLRGHSSKIMTKLFVFTRVPSSVLLVFGFSRETADWHTDGREPSVLVAKSLIVFSILDEGPP
jgi:hypothetical protein